jgi:hypothetical protein
MGSAWICMRAGFMEEVLMMGLYHVYVLDTIYVVVALEDDRILVTMKRIKRNGEIFEMNGFVRDGNGSM